MGYQAPEPAQFVVELRTGGGVAVGQIQATDYDAVDRRLDIATVDIIRIARKRSPDLGRLGIPGEDGDPIPALLSMPDHSVTGVPNHTVREFFLGRLQFLKARYIRRDLGEPAQQIGKARADAVYVVGGNPHPAYGS